MTAKLRKKSKKRRAQSIVYFDCAKKADITLVDITDSKNTYARNCGLKTFMWKVDQLNNIPYLNDWRLFSLLQKCGVLICEFLLYDDKILWWQNSLCYISVWLGSKYAPRMRRPFLNCTWDGLMIRELFNCIFQWWINKIWPSIFCFISCVLTSEPVQD